MSLRGGVDVLGVDVHKIKMIESLPTPDLVAYTRTGVVSREAGVLELFRRTSPEGVCTFMAGHGVLSGLVWAHEQGYPWDHETTSASAKGGHLDCLRYAHENGCAWGWVCEYACESGYVDCLRYAHESGCPLSGWESYMAALEGNMGCLVYAHEHGFPLDARTSRAALMSGNVDCLRYVQEHGCPE